MAMASAGDTVPWLIEFMSMAEAPTLVLFCAPYAASYCAFAAAAAARELLAEKPGPAYAVSCSSALIATTAARYFFMLFLIHSPSKNFRERHILVKTDFTSPCDGQQKPSTIRDTYYAKFTISMLANPNGKCYREKLTDSYDIIMYSGVFALHR